MYTIVPTNGNSDAAVAHPTSNGSAIRRLASAYVQYTSASQITTRNRMISSTAALIVPFLMPKTARASIKGASVVVGEVGTVQQASGFVWIVTWSPRPRVGGRLIPLIGRQGPGSFSQFIDKRDRTGIRYRRTRV